MGPSAQLTNRHRWLRLPVLRSGITFVETISLTILLTTETGSAEAARLLGWVGLCLAVDFYLSLTVVPEWIQSPLLNNAILQVLGLPCALQTLRQGLGKTVWRFHGAEHKAVNAYEAGADPIDIEAVATYSRIHDRCGTNLIAIMFVVLMLGYLLLGGLAAGESWVVYAILVVAVSLELFR